MDFIWGYLVALTMTAVLFIVISPIAKRIGLIDKPNFRKTHSNNVPLIGGIGLALSFMTSILLFDISLKDFRLLFFCLVTLLIFGVIDDYQDTSPRKKILVHFLIAVVLVVLDNKVIHNVGDIFGYGYPQGLSVLAIPFSIIAIIGVVNAFNMLDGTDGLAAFTAIISLLAVLLLLERSSVEGLAELKVLITLFVLCLVVFSVFNFAGIVGSGRQIFLGDSGSTLLGLMLVFLLIHLADKDYKVVRVCVAPWIIGLPLLDMFSVMFIRLLKRRSLIIADRNHLHHIVATYIPNKLFCLILLLSLHIGFVAFGLAATMLVLPDWLLFWGTLVLLSIVIAVILLAQKHLTTE